MKPFPTPPAPVDQLDGTQTLLYFVALRDAGYVWHLDEDPAETILTQSGQRMFTDDQAETLRLFVERLNILCLPLCPDDQKSLINAGAWEIADIVDWGKIGKPQPRPHTEFDTAEYARLYDPEKEREHGRPSDLATFDCDCFLLSATSDEWDELELDSGDPGVTAVDTEERKLTCLGWMLDNADLRHSTRHGEEEDLEGKYAAINLAAERDALKKQVEALAAALNKSHSLIARIESELQRMEEWDDEWQDAVEANAAALKSLGRKA